MDRHPTTPAADSAVSSAREHTPLRTRIARSKLVKTMKANWFQPRTKSYIHAFVDGWLCFLVVIFFTWGVLALDRDSKPIEDWGPLSVSNFQRVFVAGAGYMSMIFSTICGIATGSFMKSLGTWRLQYPEGKGGRRVVFGSAQLPVWAFVCVAVVICFVLPMLASQSIQKLSEIRMDGPRGPAMFYCHGQWFVVLASMCFVTLLAVTGGAVIRERRLALREDGLRSRNEKHAESRSTVAAPPAGMV